MAGMKNIGKRNASVKMHSDAIFSIPFFGVAPSSCIAFVPKSNVAIC
jgi:hypothetical protein